MRDGSDGAALLALVHYYCPEQMKLDGEWRMLSLNRPEREQCAFNMQKKKIQGSSLESLCQLGYYYIPRDSETKYLYIICIMCDVEIAH